MSIKGYHVSRYEYAPGHQVKIGPGEVTHFHAELERTMNIAGEDRINRHRPPGWPCRYTCIYVFETLPDCSLYGSSQHGAEKVYYYRVRVEQAVKVPMVLVDHIRKQVDPTDAQIKRMAREYWKPTRRWKFWEYLTDAIEILERVEPLSMGSFDVMRAQLSYMDDHNRAIAFCRTAMKPK